VTMRTNENAELSMRVKALEADVAALQQRSRRLESEIEYLLAKVARLPEPGVQR
jgi:hypothetical protein